MKNIIENKCGHDIDWKEAFRLTADIIRYNHYGATVANGNTADNLIFRAKKMGVTVRKYEHSVEIMTRYGEPKALSYAYDILTASKKAHPTPHHIRAERKRDKNTAEYYNVRRYHNENGIRYNETKINAQARHLRNIRRAVKRGNVADIITWTDIMSNSNVARIAELEARLNYPAQVEKTLTGKTYANRYQERLPF